MGCGGSKDEKAKPTENKAEATEKKAKPTNTKPEAAEKKAAEAKPASPKAAEAPQEAPKDAQDGVAASAPAPAAETSSSSSSSSHDEPAADEPRDVPESATPADATSAPSVPPIQMQKVDEHNDQSAAAEPAQVAPQSTAAQRSPHRASSTTPRRLQRRSQGDTTHRAVVGEDEPMVGPGPSSDFPTEVMYPCFDEGQLYRLVNEKRHMWGFYNDSTDYIMHVEATFGHESMVRALGKTAQVVHDPSTGHCTLTLDIEPLKTEPFMRGEFNGFAIAYDAEPLPYEERQKYAAIARGDAQ